MPFEELYHNRQFTRLRVYVEASRFKVDIYNAVVWRVDDPSMIDIAQFGHNLSSCIIHMHEIKKVTVDEQGHTAIIYLW